MYRSQEMLKKAMEVNVRIAELVQKSTCEDKDNKLKGLKGSMKVYCNIDHNFSKYEICSSELEKRTPSESVNNKGFLELFEEMNNDNEDITKHEMFQRLEEEIRATVQIEEDGLEIEETAPNTVCPVSKTTMKSPMTNKLCGHVYDKSSVDQLLKLNKKGIRCPVAGCVKALKFRYSNLEPNNKLKKYILQQASQKS